MNKSPINEPFEALEAIMSWEDFVNSIEEAKQLSRPMDYDYLDLLKFRFNYLRKYTPTLLESLEFTSTKSGEPLLQAIETIKEMNGNNKRKVPEGAPLDFVSNRWQKHVYDDGNINRQYYEMAVLTELRNLVRSGNVSIKGSRQHQDFDNYLVTQKKHGSKTSTLMNLPHHLLLRNTWKGKSMHYIIGLNGLNEYHRIRWG